MKTVQSLLEESCIIFNTKLIFVNHNGEEKVYNRQEFLKESKRFLSGLIAMGISQGDYLILSIEDENTFFKCFWACFLGGIVPVPLNSAKSQSVEDPVNQKLVKVWKTLGECKILSTLQSGDELASVIDSEFLLRVDDIQNIETKHAYVIPDILPDSLAMIQFSSGSTGDPKGVMLTHRNIVSNVRAISHALQLSSNDTVMCWLPHTHDMGIFGGHFCPIFSGANYVKMAPNTFLKKPNLFLKLIHSHKVTTFPTPNFGLDWLTRYYNERENSGLRLDSLKNILNGSEPISVKVMEAFYEKFKAHGLKRAALTPVYGLAEATLGVSFHGNAEEYISYNIDPSKLMSEKIAVISEDVETAIQLVSVGKAIDNVEVLIIDDHHKEMAEGQVGNIFIKGEGVTKGYINEPEQNRALFWEGWLNTGDVGFILDGNLFICDRVKNMACINGLNLFFKDIEEQVYLNTSIKRGDMITISHITHQGMEELAVFLKYKGEIDNLLGLRNEIIRVISEKFQVRLNTVIPVRQIPKTTSGKPQRGLLKKQLLNGDFETVINEIKEATGYHLTVPSRFGKGALSENLKSLLSQVLQIHPNAIPDDATFQQLGMSSLEGMRYLNKVRDIYELDLDQKELTKGYSFGEFVQICALKLSEEKVGVSKASPSNWQEEPISIIGMACKFPGSDTIQEFEKNLAEGVSFCHEVSGLRKDITGFSEWDGYLAELEKPFDFDASFFSIQEKEAKFIDPQQRLCLELAYEAILDAGIANELKSRANVGVYIGASYPSYSPMITNYVMSEESIHANTLANNTLSMIATRISKYFGLKGPALTIDTACSSSLVALDMAVKELTAGRIDKAIVGGVNLVLSPTMHLLSKHAGILSRNGECRVFDQEANGTVLGEGIGVVVLERSSSRTQAGRYCYAEIVGSAVNNDGEALSIMAPNATGQSEVIAMAHKNARIEAHEVDYLEAHGTATAIGDPVEIKSLSNVFKNKDKKCLIGSVKSNIGHLLAAAGIAGLIKSALSLRNQTVYPTANLSTQNSLIDFPSTPFVPATKLISNMKIKHSGVSSFGFGGTNAHVVLKASSPQPKSELSKFIFGLSWRNDEERVNNIKNVIRLLRNPETGLYELCANSLLRVESRGSRKAFLVSDKQELEELLQHEFVSQNTVSPPRKLQTIGLVLQGSQAMIDPALALGLQEYLDEHEKTIMTEYGQLKAMLLIASHRFLSKYCASIKLLPIDSLGVAISKYLEGKIGIDLLFEESMTDNQSIVELESLKIPMIGLEKLEKEDFLALEETKDQLVILGFLYEHGIPVLWHKLYSLSGVPNWGIHYHPFERKTHILPKIKQYTQI